MDNTTGTDTDDDGTFLTNQEKVFLVRLGIVGVFLCIGTFLTIFFQIQ